MKTLVLDNSVILKAFFDEEGREKVLKMLFLKTNAKLQILVPDLFPYEFFNIYSRFAGPQQAIKAFDHLLVGQFSIVPLDEKILKTALNLIQKYTKISFYDAAYHALAITHKTDFVTADQEYCKLTKNEGHLKYFQTA